MKKAYFLAVALLLVGAIAFAQSEGGEVAVGFTMGFDNDKDLGNAAIPGVDLTARVYFLDLGTKSQPLNVGVSLLASVGFPDTMNWKVPGEKDPKDKKKGNAFWPGGTDEQDDPKPIAIGSQVLLPGATVHFAVDETDALLNVGLLVGLSFQAGFGGGAGFVADLGFAGSMDAAVFESDYMWVYYPKGSSHPDAEKDKEDVKQRVEITTFNFGIGGNLGFQYRIPMSGNSSFIVELGSGFSLYFSRTSSIDWYYANKDNDKKGDSLWQEETPAETVTLFRASPYITFGVTF